MFSLLSTTVQNSTLVMLRALVYQLLLNILSIKQQDEVSSIIQTMGTSKFTVSGEADGAELVLKTRKKSAKHT